MIVYEQRSVAGWPLDVFLPPQLTIGCISATVSARAWQGKKRSDSRLAEPALAPDRHIYIYTYVHIYIYIHTHIYIHIYTHTYIHTYVDL